MNPVLIIWVFFILSAFLPMIKQRRLDSNRLKLLRYLQGKRGSRVITLIHRQEHLSFLGIPLTRFINIEDSELILRAIRLTPDHVPIDLILHTPGGLVLASEQISTALQKHPAKVTVFVPHYAMSGGTMIALAADEIVMDDNAVLGPVDPQIGSFPAASIISTVEQKSRDEVDDQTLILADIAKKALIQVEETIFLLLKKHLNEENAHKTAKLLSQGKWTHDYPIRSDMLRDFGLKVSTDVPLEIYSLMDLYPQPPQRRPSVQYIPLPAETSDKRR
ncbi:MAG: ATP-dependent Clp protease proteolytic subunit [Clostridiales bacterium]|nr:ATP-dependent Clp protease proteolytic subunit [Clostridiales bacterium]